MFVPLGVSVVLLTGSMTGKQKKDVRERIAAGEVQVVIGTHALLSESTRFDNLGLVITDEQHRFGVGQRSRLSAKGEDPHLLVMSATPIPRTLALILYGDLDVSILDELPGTDGVTEIGTLSFYMCLNLRNITLPENLKNTLGSHPTFIRWAIRLRQLRLTQWLDSLKSHLSPQKEFSDNLMKYVVKEQVIPYKSKLFQQGLEQFQNNMKLVLNLFKKHQIPVFFSTVGVNLKDLKPFKSISSDEHSADEYYQLAQEQLQAQDSIAAYTSFSRARDLDALRFRASKEINEIIRELAKDDDNIYLVNTEEEFNRKKPVRYSRRELLLEQ